MAVMQDSVRDLLPRSAENFRVEKEIYRSRKTILFLAHPRDGGPAAVLKVPVESGDVVTEGHISHEANLLRSLRIPGVPAALEASQPGMLVREFVPGITLASYLQQLEEPLGLPSFLDLMQQLVRLLVTLHKDGITHRDLHPNNLILDVEKYRLHLIDFGLATRFDGQIIPHVPPPHLEGALGYIAPEQTGRMNRGVDYRADLYALGMLAYELLVGSLPFTSQDPLELIHAHLALLPVSPLVHRTDIPEPLGNLILRLLAKDPEFRYQSASGVLHDLQEIERALAGKIGWDEFSLGSHDRPFRFEVSQRLYGRNEERQLLLDSFDEIREVGKQLWLIGGASGIGKSALVAEIHGPISEARGLYLSGKFEQMQSGITYFAWRQVLEKLTSVILSEPEHLLSVWRSRLQSAVGSNGKIILDLCPSMIRVLGEQPELTYQDTRDNQKRFLLVFKRFFAALPSAARPLVIFLDDWQWADRASVLLLRELFEEVDLKHVLFLCAYRPEEVPSEHPFYRTFLGEKPLFKLTPLTACQRMILQPLSTQEIEELLQDTLGAEENFIPEISQVIFQKTLGNSFFVHQLLKTLYSQQILRLHTTTGASGWELDLKGLRKLEVTDNVVEFMVGKLKSLPEEVLRVLQVASCIGNDVRMDLLSRVMQWDRAKLNYCLILPLVERLITPEGGNPHQYEHFRFIHDSVQQAFYALLPASEKAALHVKVAQALEEALAGAASTGEIFDMVNSYNAGKVAIQSEAQQIHVAWLNLKAAKLAHELPAYETAWQYAQYGLSLLGTSCWVTQYPLMRDLHQQALRNAYYAGDVATEEEKIHLLEALTQHAHSALDEVLALEIKMEYFKFQHQYQEALEVGLVALKVLGFSVPKPNKVQVIQSVLKAKWRLGRLGFDKLESHPVTEDPHAEAVERIFLDVGNVAYSVKPEYMALMAQPLIREISRRGFTCYSSFSLLSFSLIMIAGLGRIGYGYRLSSLANRIQPRLKPTKWEGRIQFMDQAFVRHWVEPMNEVIQASEEGYHWCVESGDFEFAAFSTHMLAFLCFIAGTPLRELKNRCAAWQEAHRKPLGVRTLYQEFLAIHCLVSWLTEDDTHYRTWEGGKVDEEELLSTFAEGNNQGALSFFHYARFVYHSILDEAAAAHDALLAFEEYAEGAQASAFWGHYMFLKGMLLAKLYPTVGVSQRRSYRKEIQLTIQYLRMRKKFNLDNFEHKQLLVEAEWYRARQARSKANEKYLLAIKAAELVGRLPDMAVAHERYGDFTNAIGHTGLARLHIREAYRLYYRWHCPPKLRKMEKQHPGWVGKAGQGQTMHVETTQTQALSIDIMSFVKSSQAISGEIVLEQLLEKMLEVVLENAGAQRGVLLFLRQQKMVIQAEIDTTQDFRSVNEPQLLLEVEQRVPASMVYYVARSGKTLVLSDPHAEDEYHHDPYFTQRQPRSVLCLPLTKQSQVLGILYLEHFAVADVFASDRLSVLNLLCAQMAISLENAFLYEDLEDKVKERTEEVTLQKSMLEQQKQQMESSNEKLMASIRYAKDIQNAILVPPIEVRRMLPESFILFKPRDVVSGDFHWVRRQGEKTFIAAVDCTGHGVPGALMSMIGNSLLDEILTKKQLESPEAMLTELRQNVGEALRQQDSFNRDGMDISLVVIDHREGILKYAGAFNNLAVIQHGKLSILKADRIPIGGVSRVTNPHQEYTLHEVALRDEHRQRIPTTFYLFTDGFQDQFGGPEKKKFTMRRFYQLLQDVSELTMSEQHHQLNRTLTRWMHAGQEDQVDDILVIGVRLG